MAQRTIRTARLSAARPLVLPGGDACVESWGWLPALSLVSACGLLLAALAATAARHSAAWATPLFWIVLLVLFAPSAARLLSSQPARRERIGLVVMLGVALYLVKVIDYPQGFTFHDEFSNWRTANDILQSHHLFAYNPIEWANPLYPGLGTVTNALASLSGLSLFAAGVIIIGIAQLILVLALFLLYERISRSARIAAIATALYMANPNFLFFDDLFAYESLALPLAIMTLLVVVTWSSAPDRHRVGLGLAASIGVGAVVVSHHLTSYALLVFLGLWTAVALCTTPRGREWLRLAGMTALTLAAIVAWTVGVARPVPALYLAPPLIGAVTQFVHLITGQTGPKQVFGAGGGHLAPLWDRVTGYGSVVSILLGLPFGLRQVWRRHRSTALAGVLALGGLAYPASLGLRLTQAGTETSNRSSEFLFVGVAFVLAVGVVELWLPWRAGWKRMAAITTWAAVIFVGGAAVGSTPAARLPGPYIVNGAVRVLASQPQSVTAAQWAATFLGPGNRILTDATNKQIMGSYGEQDPQSGAAGTFDVSLVFFDPHFDADVKDVLHYDGVRYLVVDRRLSHALPADGWYYDVEEPGAHQHTAPVSPSLLAKFDHVRGASRLFDSGAIVIYDVGAFAGCATGVGVRNPCIDAHTAGSAKSLPVTRLPPRGQSSSPQRPAVIPSGPPAATGLLINPNIVRFGVQAVDTASPVMDIHVVNLKATPLRIAGVSVAGLDRHSFREVDNCTGATIVSYTGCAIEVGFTPTMSRNYAATIVLTDGAGHRYRAASLSGRGRHGRAPAVPDGTQSSGQSQSGPGGT